MKNTLNNPLILNNLYIHYHSNPSNQLPYFPYTYYKKSKHNLSTLIKYKLLKLTKFNQSYHPQQHSTPTSTSNTTYLLYTNIPLPLFLKSLIFTLISNKFHSLTNYNYY
mgnify:CR=1 FL=1